MEGEQRRALILKSVIDLVTYKPKRGGTKTMRTTQGEEGGRAEKESHEGGETDTKHGFIKGSGGGWPGKKAEKGEQWRVVWPRGKERIKPGEQRRGE